MEENCVKTYVRCNEIRSCPSDKGIFNRALIVKI